MMRILAVLIFVGLNFTASGQEKVIPGKVIDTIRCQLNERQSYALYLPQGYTRTKTWPVLFFYDPAARGNVPVKMYASLAEKYQCILVGSNNSRNGPLNVTQEAEQAILRDVESKFSIEKSRLFISGFSGGARVSVFLSQQRKIYAGIIACGAAFPTTGKLMIRDNIPFVEIVGNQDMNFTEALDANDYLKSISYPHALILFQGTHAWPPSDEFEQAFFWQLFRLKPPSKSLMNTYDSLVLKNAKQAIESGDWWMANWNITNAISLSPRVDSLKKSVSANSNFIKQQKGFPGVLQKENDLLQNIYARFGRLTYAQDDSVFKEEEWNNLIATLKRFSKSANIHEVNMSERVLQLGRIGCYETYKQQMELKRYLQASLISRVLVLLQPEPNTYVMLAKPLTKMDRRRDAIQALSKATELGLKDVKVINGNDFSSLVNDKKFGAVKQQVELNSKKSP